MRLTRQRVNCARGGAHASRGNVFISISITIVALLIIISESTTTTTGQILHQNTSKFEFRIQEQNVKSSPAATTTTTASKQLNETTTSLVNNGDGQLLASFSDMMLRTFIRINIMRVYHMDLHSYRQGTKFSGDPSFVNSQNLEDRRVCERHLMKYYHLLKSFRELENPMQANIPYEAMNLADVYGRPEAGALMGNQFWLGSYEGCLDFKLADKQQQQTTTINSQYCMGITGFPNWNPAHTKSALKVGLCLPETCTNSMVNDEKHLFEMVEQMMKYQFGSDSPYKRVQLKQIYCLPHETSEARQYSLSAKLLIAFSATMICACLVATVFDYIDGKMPENLKANERTRRSIIVKAFSVSRNVRKIFTTSREQPQQNAQTSQQQQQQQLLEQQQMEGKEDGVFDRNTFFSVISGLKCIGLMWICCAHTFLVSPITDQNMISMDKLTKTYAANILLTAHLMVDTFFALSGLLASYLLFRDGLHKYQTKHWIIMTVHRYWRLTPIYILCYWFTKSLGKSFGEGPFWDYGTAADSPRLQCENESWATALLHQSDYKSPKDHCIPFAWFIANGIKFWMVTPIFLVLIHKSMRRGYQFTAAVIVANMVLVGRLAFNSGVDMKSVIELKPESADNMLNNMGEVYTRPYSRIGTYLIGLLAGHLIYMIESKQLRVNLSANVNMLIWAWFSLTTILLTFVIKLAGGVELDERAIPWVFSISSALLRPLWALCTCWLVFALSTGQAVGSAKFLSSNIWQILVKLSFCAYLAQGEVIAQLYLGQTASSSYRYIDMIARPIVVICLTFVVSALMVVFFEYPLIGIEELIFPPKRPVQQQQQANDKKHEQALTANDGLSTGQTKSIDDSDKSQEIISNGEKAKVKSL